MGIWLRLFTICFQFILVVVFAISCKFSGTDSSLSDTTYTEMGKALADSIHSLSPERRMLGLIKSYSSIISKKDSQQAIAMLNAAEQTFKEKGSAVLRRQAWLLQFAYRAERKPVGEAAASIMLQAAEKAAAKEWPVTEAECWHYAGSYYFRGNQFVPAFEYLRKAQNVFDKSESVENLYLLRYAGGLALCYYQFGEYAEAIRYMKKELQMPSFWTEFYYSPDINNTIGLCYQQLRQYDSAAIWFNRSHELAATYKDSFYMALANGNLGYTYYLQQQYDKAWPLMEADYAASVKAHETGSAMNAASTLTDIYIKKGQLADAEKYMSIVKEYVFSTRNLPLLRFWYENLFNLARAKADLKSINLYTDSMLVYKDSIARMRDKKVFNQEVLKLETEKHMNEVNQLESRRKHQVLLRNSLLVSLVLIAIIALLWINRQLLKRNKEQELARQELEFAGHELQSYMQQLKEKNELVEQLTSEISRENDSAERTGMINHLLSATILTEEDWKKFRELFEKVYPGFFIRMREKFPDLSPTETRLFALTRLQMSPKDMAAMLGVSYDAIRKARQRVRKKIDLPEEGDLEELVNMI